MGIHQSIREFRCGTDRLEDKALTHTYAETDDGLFPMCGYGWNRSNGEYMSILRSPYGTEGDCKLCRRNLWGGKPPVTEGFPHKTKWL